MAITELPETGSPPDDEILSSLSDPDALYEIEYGRVVEKTRSALACWIAFELAAGVREQVRRLKLGFVVTETVFILDRLRDLHRRPDVAFVSKERWPLDRALPYRGDWEVVPNLVVEVVSPSNQADELLKKRRQYFKYGVEEVWVIYPEERLVEVYTKTGMREFTHEQRLTTPVMPGVEVELAPLLPIVEPESST